MYGTRSKSGKRSNAIHRQDDNNVDSNSGGTSNQGDRGEELNARPRGRPARDQSSGAGNQMAGRPDRQAVVDPRFAAPTPPEGGRGKRERKSDTRLGQQAALNKADVGDNLSASSDDDDGVEEFKGPNVKKNKPGTSSGFWNLASGGMAAKASAHLANSRAKNGTTPAPRIQGPPVKNRGPGRPSNAHQSSSPPPPTQAARSRTAMPPTIRQQQTNMQTSAQKTCGTSSSGAPVTARSTAPGTSGSSFRAPQSPRALPPPSASRSHMDQSPPTDSRRSDAPAANIDGLIEPKTEANKGLSEDERNLIRDHPNQDAAVLLSKYRREANLLKEQKKEPMEHIHTVREEEITVEKETKPLIIVYEDVNPHRQQPLPPSNPTPHAIPPHQAPLQQPQARPIQKKAQKKPEELYAIGMHPKNMFFNASFMRAKTNEAVLENVSEQPIAFQLLFSTPDRHSANLNTGIIGPKSQFKFNITCASFGTENAPDEGQTHKLCVQYTNVPLEVLNVPLENLEFDENWFMGDGMSGRKTMNIRHSN